MTPVDELRQAAARLRAVSEMDAVCEPLAALLDYCAKQREACEKGAAFVSDDSGRITADQIDQLTPYALRFARAINGGAR